MMGISVLVVNVLCALLLIIEKARRSYMQSIECNKTIRISLTNRIFQRLKPQ
jgi:hypothetical protein